MASEYQAGDYEDASEQKWAGVLDFSDNEDEENTADGTYDDDELFSDAEEGGTFVPTPDEDMVFSEAEEEQYIPPARVNYVDTDEDKVFADSFKYVDGQHVVVIYDKEKRTTLVTITGAINALPPKIINNKKFPLKYSESRQVYEYIFPSVKDALAKKDEFFTSVTNALTAKNIQYDIVNGNPSSVTIAPLPSADDKFMVCGNVDRIPPRFFEQLMEYGKKEGTCLVFENKDKYTIENLFRGIKWSVSSGAGSAPVASKVRVNDMFAVGDTVKDIRNGDMYTVNNVSRSNLELKGIDNPEDVQSVMMDVALIRYKVIEKENIIEDFNIGDAVCSSNVDKGRVVGLEPQNGLVLVETYYGKVVKVPVSDRTLKPYVVDIAVVASQFHVGDRAKFRKAGENVWNEGLVVQKTEKGVTIEIDGEPIQVGYDALSLTPVKLRTENPTTIRKTVQKEVSQDTSDPTVQKKLRDSIVMRLEMIVDDHYPDVSHKDVGMFEANVFDEAETFGVYLAKVVTIMMALDPDEEFIGRHAKFFRSHVASGLFRFVHLHEATYEHILPEIENNVNLNNEEVERAWQIVRNAVSYERATLVHYVTTGKSKKTSLINKDMIVDDYILSDVRELCSNEDGKSVEEGKLVLCHEDGLFYCMSVDTVADIIRTQATPKNPYTNNPFDETFVQRIKDMYSIEVTEKKSEPIVPDVSQESVVASASTKVETIDIIRQKWSLDVIQFSDSAVDFINEKGLFALKNIVKNLNEEKKGQYDVRDLSGATNKFLLQGKVTNELSEDFASVYPKIIKQELDIKNESSDIRQIYTFVTGHVDTNKYTDKLIFGLGVVVQKFMIDFVESSLDYDEQITESTMNQYIRSDKKYLAIFDQNAYREIVLGKQKPDTPVHQPAPKAVPQPPSRSAPKVEPEAPKAAPRPARSAPKAAPESEKPYKQAMQFSQSTTFQEKFIEKLVTVTHPETKANKILYTWINVEEMDAYSFCVGIIKCISKGLPKVVDMSAQGVDDSMTTILRKAKVTNDFLKHVTSAKGTVKNPMRANVRAMISREGIALSFKKNDGLDRLIIMLSEIVYYMMSQYVAEARRDSSVVVNLNDIIQDDKNLKKLLC